MTAQVYASGRPATRSRVYPVLGRIRWGYRFEPCVVPPQLSDTGRPRVEWGNFHSVVPLHPEARGGSSKHHPQQQQQHQDGGQWPDTAGQGRGSWTSQGRGKGGSAQQPGVRTSTEVVQPLDRGMSGCAVTAWLTHHEEHQGGADTASSAGGHAAAAAAAAAPAAAGQGAEAGAGYTPPRLPSGSTAGQSLLPQVGSSGLALGAAGQGAGGSGGGGGVRSSTTNSPAWTPNTTLNTRQASVASGGSGQNPWARMGFAGGLQQWQQELAAEAERQKQEAAAAAVAAGGTTAPHTGAAGGGAAGEQEGVAAAGAAAGGAGATTTSSSGAGADLPHNSSSRQQVEAPEQAHSVLTIHKARAEAGPSEAGGAGAGAGLPPAAPPTASAPYSLSTASRPVLSNITRSTSGASGSSRRSTGQSAQSRQLPEQQQQQEGGFSTAPVYGAGPGEVGARMGVHLEAWGPDPDDITVCEKHVDDSWHTKRSLATAMAAFRESMEDKRGS